MDIKIRVNPKTGKTEYKARYYFMRDGKREIVKALGYRYNHSKHCLCTYTGENFLFFVV